MTLFIALALWRMAAHLEPAKVSSPWLTLLLKQSGEVWGGVLLSLSLEWFGAVVVKCIYTVPHVTNIWDATTAIFFFLILLGRGMSEVSISMPVLPSSRHGSCIESPNLSMSQFDDNSSMVPCFPQRA